MFDISRFRQYISDIFNEVSYVLLEMETEFCPSGSFPRKFSCVLENEQTSSSASGVRDALLPDSGTGEGSGYRLRGGFFIASMLRRAPEAHFCGVDYSPVSVKKTLAFNRRAVRTGQVEAVEGSVSNLPFAEASFDLATASETIYFWPDPANDVREVFRVLRPGGTFAVCCDSSNPETAKRYTDRIHGMKVYTPAELCAFLSGAGFSEVEAHCDPASEMVCVIGRK